MYILVRFILDNFSYLGWISMYPIVSALCDCVCPSIAYRTRKQWKAMGSFLCIRLRCVNIARFSHCYRFLYTIDGQTQSHNPDAFGLFFFRNKLKFNKCFSDCFAFLKNANDITEFERLIVNLMISILLCKIVCRLMV